MTSPPPPPPRPQLRREPPTYRRVAVRRVTWSSPRLVRVTLAGPELDGFAVDEPAASVRLLLPSPGTDELVMPEWNGNEFLLADGRRPALRTLTPLPAPGDDELDVEIVVHDGGFASRWATSAAPGAPVAVSGPGRGYKVDPEAPAYLVGGDETALPAIGQVLAAIPPGIPVQVHVEVAHPDARLALPDHPAATVTWHDLPSGGAPGDALVAAVTGVAADLVPGTRVWAAGEAAAVQRIRKHLFEERSFPRPHASIRGYWKC